MSFVSSPLSNWIKTKPHQNPRGDGAQPTEAAREATQYSSYPLFRQPRPLPCTSAQCPPAPTAQRAPGGSNSCCSPCSSVTTLTPTPPGCCAHEAQHRARSQQPQLPNSSCESAVSAHAFTPRLCNTKTLTREHFQPHLGLETAGEHPALSPPVPRTHLVQHGAGLHQLSPKPRVLGTPASTPSEPW